MSPLDIAHLGETSSTATGHKPFYVFSIHGR
jgi:hypothetical protein